MSADAIHAWADGLEIVMSGSDVDLTTAANIKGPASELVCIDGGDVGVVLASSGGAVRVFHNVQPGTSLAWQIIRIDHATTNATTFWAGWR